MMGKLSGFILCALWIWCLVLLSSQFAYAASCDGDQTCGNNQTVCNPPGCDPLVDSPCSCPTECVYDGTDVGCSGVTKTACETTNWCAPRNKCQASNSCSFTCIPDCSGGAGTADGCGGTCGGVAPIATNTPVPPGCTSDSQCPSGQCCRYNACTVDCGPPACDPTRNTDCFLDNECGDAPGQHEWCPSGKGLDGQNCSESSDGDNYCERNGTQYCCGKIPTFAPCNPANYPSKSTIVINPNVRTNRSNSDRFDVRVADIPTKFGNSANPEGARDADPSGCCNLETQVKIGPSAGSLYTPRGYGESCTVSGMMCTVEDGQPAQSAPWGADWKYGGGKVCAQAYVKGTASGSIVTNCFNPGAISGVMNTPKVLPGGSVSFAVTISGADGVPPKVRLHDTTRGGESNASYYDDNNIVWREDGGTIQQNADVLLHGCTVTKSGNYTWNFTCLAGTSNMWNGTSSLGAHKVVFSNQYNVETELSYELVEGPPSCNSWSSVKINNCDSAMWGSNPRNVACFTASTTVPVNLSWDLGATDIRFVEVANSVGCATVANDDSRWSAWEAVAATKNKAVSLGYGEKKLCVQYRNTYGSSQACGAMTEYYVAPRCVSWDDINVNGCVFSAWNSSPRSLACYLNSTTASLNLAYDSGVDKVRFVEIESVGNCAGVGSTDSRWSAWEAVVATKNKAMSSGSGDKKICVQYRNTGLPVDSINCGGMTTYCAAPALPVFSNISGVIIGGTTSCGSYSATCVSEGAPVWNWTGVDGGGACAIRETYITSSDMADTLIKPGKIDTYAVSMSLAQNACVSVTAKYKNGSMTGNGFTPVWVKSDSVGPMTPSLSLDCSYYGLVGGAKRFNVGTSWGVVADNGCAGVKNYQVDTADNSDFLGASLRQAVTTATRQNYTNLMSEGTVYGKVKATDNFNRNSSWSTTVNKIISCDNCGGCGCVCNAPYCGQENGCGDYCPNTDVGVPPVPTTISPGATDINNPEIISNPGVTIAYKWNANSDVLTDGYYFGVWDANDAMVTEMNLAGKTTNQHVANSSLFTDGVVYHWQTRAINSTCSTVQESDYSVPRYFVVNRAIPTVPPATPVPAAAPQLNGFVIKNADGTLVGTSDGRNHICENTFVGSSLGRRVIFEATVSDGNGLGDITSAKLGWGAKLYDMGLTGSGNNGVARVVVDFLVGDNGPNVDNLNVYLVDSGGTTNTTTDTDRDFKVWDCQVKISGNLFDGSKATLGIPSCSSGSGFSDPIGIDYGLMFKLKP